MTINKTFQPTSRLRGFSAPAWQRLNIANKKGQRPLHGTLRTPNKSVKRDAEKSRRAP